MKRSPLIILFVTVVIDLLGFGIVFPVLPLYVERFHGEPIVAGFLSTSYSAMQFLFAPLWGRASDLWGRRPFLLLSLIGSALAFTLFGLATNIPMLFAARIASGILTAAGLTTAYAYVADVTTPEKRSRGMALVGIAFGVGMAFGPPIGGYLSRWSLSTPPLFVAGLALLNFVWSYFALPETHTTDRDAGHARRLVLLDLGRLGEALRRPVLGRLLAVFTVATFAFVLMEATLIWLILLRFVQAQHPGLPVQVLEQVAAPTVGNILLVVGITIFVVQGAVMSGLAQRVGENRLVWVGSAVLALALVGLGRAGTLTAVAVFAALLAVGDGLLNPSLSSLVSKAAGSGERGGALGVQQGLGSLARMIAPPIGTGMLRWSGLSSPYYLSGTLMAVAFVLSLALPRQPAPEEAKPSAARR